ncbi:MAG: hypothetical protein ACYDGL_00915 [Bellilinea sp.]
MPNNLTEEQLLAKLRFAVDQATLEQAKRAVDSVDRGLLKSAQSADEYRKKLAAARESAEKLQQVGTTLGIAGAAIMAPFLLAARSYQQAIGEGEETSRRWTAANDRLKEAQIRVGRETTEALLPLMEKGADLADKFATLVEKHPDLVKAILIAGGSLAAAGTVVSLIAQTQKLIATVQLLTTGAGAGALSKLGALAANPYVGTTLAIGTAAYAAYDALAQTETGKSRNMEAAPGQLATVAAYELGRMFGGSELASKWGKAIGELTGALPKATAETEKYNNAVSQTTQKQMAVYLDYVKAERAAAVQYQQRQAELTRNYQQQLAADAAEYNRSRTRAMRDFYNSERQVEADYYRSRLQAARSYSIEAARAEEDHQRRIQQLREDYNDQAEDLIASRDALGLVRATRDYDRARRDADDEFRIESSRRAEDFARTQAEQAEQFAIQRAQRIAEFKQQMVDEAEAYDLQRRQAAEQYQQQMAELQKNYNDERKKRRQAMIDQLSDLSDGLNRERQLRQQFTAAMLADFRAAMNQAGLAVPTRHSGGYTSDGLYLLKRGEFVLAPETTSAAEKMAGRTLSQDNMLAMLAGNGGAGRTIVYQDNRKFDSRLSSQDRALIRRDTDIRLNEVLNG